MGRIGAQSIRTIQAQGDGSNQARPFRGEECDAIAQVGVVLGRTVALE
jgi:hypothetical protein